MMAGTKTKGAALRNLSTINPLISVVGLLDGLNGDERTHVTESAFYLAKLAKAAIDAVGSRHE